LKITKILKFVFGKAKSIKNADITQHTFSPADISHAYGNKKIINGCSVFKGESKNLYYTPEFKLGGIINSGIEATVYDIKNYKNLVARVERNYKFNPYRLKQVKNDIRGVIASSDYEKVRVMTKFSGEPLYGKGWDLRKKPDQQIFESTLDKLNELPDSTYSQLIEDIINIRKKGFDIDNINPNNFLLDMKSKKINIVDISESNEGIKGVDLGDIIEPLLDDRRIMYLDKLNETTKAKIKSFIDRIIAIGQSKNLKFELEKPNHSRLQNSLVYIYHDDKKMIDFIHHEIARNR